MKPEVRREIQRLIKEEKLNCTVEEFKDRVDWNYISCYRVLSDSFIREFKDKVDWKGISCHQKLSNSFIRGLS